MTPSSPRGTSTPDSVQAAIGPLGSGLSATRRRAAHSRLRPGGGGSGDDVRLDQAAPTSSSGPRTSGDDVIQSRVGAVFGSSPAAAARRRSRSVRMPMTFSGFCDDDGSCLRRGHSLRRFLQGGLCGACDRRGRHQVTYDSRHLIFPFDRFPPHDPWREPLCKY